MEEQKQDDMVARDPGRDQCGSRDDLTDVATAALAHRWVLVPRDPSRKLIEDLASEWCYNIEEACESYQGFLEVVERHGFSGSDPAAYDSAPTLSAHSLEGE